MTLLITYLVTIFVSAAMQALAMNHQHTSKDFGYGFVLSMVPIANLAIAGFALGGFLKSRGWWK